ncbi:ComEC/Rec2 family competence protein [Candidatus Neomarinimicrobiota bacterium]
MKPDHTRMSLFLFRGRMYLVVCLCAWQFLAVVPGQAQTVGEVLPEWSEGMLDIHHINTGKGESTLVIFPDATSLLIDAGAVDTREPHAAPARPDSSRKPGEWIARYAKHVLPTRHKAELDYVLLTHFHSDHMGYVSERSEMASNGQYKLTGLTEVAEYLRIHKLIDRGWPEYDWPSPRENESKKNYRSFIEWQRENRQLVVEQFKPGRRDQIALVNKSKKYPGVEVRNIASNGWIWTGVADETRNHFPDLDSLAREDQPGENMCSIVIRLSYGRFDYFTGGDIPGIVDTGVPEWQDLETPIAKVVGPVEVNVLNHHGYSDSENAFFLKTLRPRVHIIPAWAPSHPGQRVLYRLYSERLYPGPRDIFITNLLPESRIVLGSWMMKFQSEQGHVVVRVAPGGNAYVVIILDDTTEEFRVKAVHGPYSSS